MKNNLSPVKSYLALGDSYTIGESVAIEHSWPHQLVAELSKKGQSINLPKIIAKTGWTTNELISSLHHDQPNFSYDIVSLLIGVNNQYRGESIARFTKEFSALLDLAIQFSDQIPENVFVVSIPDWGVSPYADLKDRDTISTEIDEFNSAKKEICCNRNIQFIDITEISRLALNNKIHIAKDNLHFSGAMYKLWVEEIIKQRF